MSSAHRVSTRKPVFPSWKSDATGVDLTGSEGMFSPDTSQLSRQLAFLSFSNVNYELPFIPLNLLVLVPPPRRLPPQVPSSPPS